MARNDNVVVLTGNLTREPELRFTTSGKAVASFGVAWNERKRDANGGWTDGDAHFFDVTCWESLAENMAESLTKGDRVTVTGRLRFRAWETDDGDKRSKVEIVADDVAPSLAWATAQVTRTTKAKDSGGGSRVGPPPDDDDHAPF